jgi:lysophospholipase L1-like esterase
MTKRLLTLFLSLVISILCLEVGIRIFQRVVPGYSPGVQFSTFDSELGWRHVRGVTGLFRGPDFQTPVQINRLGLRGKDIPEVNPDPKTVRILFLGDSVTAGFEVDEAETFVARVRSQLNRCGGGTIRFETINAGVRGYGTDQSLLYYEREGNKLGASLVVYTLVQNDIFENVQKAGLGKYYLKPRFHLNGNHLSLEKGHLRLIPRSTLGTLDSIKRFLRLRSRVYGWTASRIARIGKQGPDWIPEIFPEYSSSKKDRSDQRAALFRALLERMRDAVGAEGAQLIVLINPADFEIDRAQLTRLLALRIPEDQLEKAQLNPDAFHERYRAIVSELGIPVVEPLPAFRRAAREGRRLFVSDGHPNGNGHALMARLLMEKIGSERLIPLPSEMGERCHADPGQQIASDPRTQEE